MRLTRLGACLLAFAFVAASSREARAADPHDRAVCTDAVMRAQSLLDDHKLLAAREQLLVCGRAVCPAPVLKDCVAWFNDATARTPALELSAADAAGRDLADVSVTIDGVRVAEKLTGLPIEVDPGTHLVLFESADGAKVEQRVLARVGEKHTRVAATFERSPSVATGVAPGPREESSGGRGPAAAEASPPGSSMRTAGFVTGGIGLVGVAVGGAFGFTAMGKLHDAGCSQNACKDLAAWRAGESAAVGADIGLIAGGVLVAAGVTLVLVSPRAPARRQASMEPVLRLAPLTVANGAGLQLRATW